jgi:hypothetical protein
MKLNDKYHKQYYRGVFSTGMMYRDVKSEQSPEACLWLQKANYCCKPCKLSVISPSNDFSFNMSQTCSLLHAVIQGPRFHPTVACLSSSVCSFQILWHYPWGRGEKSKCVEKIQLPWSRGDTHVFTLLEKAGECSLALLQFRYECPPKGLLCWMFDPQAGGSNH